MSVSDKTKALFIRQTNSIPTKISQVCSIKSTNPGDSVKTCSYRGGLDNYNYKETKGDYDRRVQLNCCPIDKSGGKMTGTFADRVAYVLGREIVNPKYNTSKCGNWYIYGVLHSLLSSSAGLIFPYTPKISVKSSVNYEKVDITHSNLSYNYYKNTTPPSYSVTAKFTADNRENAKHMLSALWFLMATTKCEFGENTSYNTSDTTTDNDALIGGLPPPILYLNGYNKLYENIPVVVKSFNYSLPDDMDFVNLKINISKKDLDVSYQIESNYNNSALSATQFINGELVNNLNTVSSDAVTVLGGGNNKLTFSYWLPLELIISIELDTQPNLLKHKKLFNLDDYKTGVLFLNNDQTVSDLKTVSPKEYTSVVFIDDLKTGATMVKGKQEYDYKLNSYSFNKSGWFW